MVRPGIALYGHYPEKGMEDLCELRPVMTLKTRVDAVRRVPAGSTVSYGRTAELSEDTVLAVLPVGYADGLDRHLGCGVWSMLVGGVKAPIVGRVCMDSCMIDVTDVPNVAEGDEVTVFSSVAGNTAEDMAILLGTIPYEVLTSVSGRVKRIYVKE